MPCGLAARDTLRLEAGFPLFGHELGARHQPALHAVRVGGQGQTRLRDRRAPRPRAAIADWSGIVLDGRPIPRDGYQILAPDGGEVGRVTSGTLSPLTRRSIALGVDRRARSPTEGSRIAVEVRGQPAPGIVTAPPFYRP